MNYTTKVTVRHWRFDDVVLFDSRRHQKHYLRAWNRKQPPYAPCSRGGKTEVAIDVFDEHGDPLVRFIGVALCSMKDNFCYKLGREIAYGRALKQLEEWRNSFAVAHPEYKFIQV